MSELPAFALVWNGPIKSLSNQFTFDHNCLKRIVQFSMSTYSIETLSFAFNSISAIEFNAFYYLKSLSDLSMANNELTRIEKNNFYSLNSLKYLNLTRNRISFIEYESFINLNKLVSLDLSFNRGLFAIETKTFLGLSYLNELFLFSFENDTYSLKLNNKSFSHLINIGNIYLDKSVIVENKCLFMHTIVRDIKRSIANRFKFYKALNLISPVFDSKTDNKYDRIKCELVFEFFQLKIYFNLKSDYEFEVFQRDCEHFLISESNKFKSNYNKCFKIQSSIENSPSKDDDTSKKNTYIYVFSDFGVYFFWSYLAFVVFIAVYFLLENNHNRPTISKFPSMIHHINCFNDTKEIYQKELTDDVNVKIEIEQVHGYNKKDPIANDSLFLKL